MPIKKDGLKYFLTDSLRNVISRPYTSLEFNDSYLIGRIEKGEALIDVKTGEPLSEFYDVVEVFQGVIIGHDKQFMQRVLDGKTGKEISKVYKLISIREGKPYALENGELEPI
jgi:hypothetical protein